MADIQDRDGAPDVLKSIRHAFPWLRHIIADAAYAGPKLRGLWKRLARAPSGTGIRLNITHTARRCFDGVLRCYKRQTVFCDRMFHHGRGSIEKITFLPLLLRHIFLSQLSLASRDTWDPHLV